MYYFNDERLRTEKNSVNILAKLKVVVFVHYVFRMFGRKTIVKVVCFVLVSKKSVRFFRKTLSSLLLDGRSVSTP